jgi:hypothetical protein
MQKLNHATSKLKGSWPQEQHLQCKCTQLAQIEVYFVASLAAAPSQLSHCWLASLQTDGLQLTARGEQLGAACNQVTKACARLHAVIMTHICLLMQSS